LLSALSALAAQTELGRTIFHPVFGQRSGFFQAQVVRFLKVDVGHWIAPMKRLAGIHMRP